jgi:hypothetical protein
MNPLALTGFFRSGLFSFVSSHSFALPIPHKTQLHLASTLSLRPWFSCFPSRVGFSRLFEVSARAIISPTRRLKGSCDPPRSSFVRTIFAIRQSSELTRLRTETGNRKRQVLREFTSTTWPVSRVAAALVRRHAAHSATGGNSSSAGPFQAVRSRNMAQERTNSLRATAMIACFLRVFWPAWMRS